MHMRGLANLGNDKIMPPPPCHSLTLKGVPSIVFCISDRKSISVDITCGSSECLGCRTHVDARHINDLGAMEKVKGNMKETEERDLRALKGYKRARGAQQIRPLDTRYNMAISSKENHWFNDARRIEHFEHIVQAIPRD